MPDSVAPKRGDAHVAALQGDFAAALLRPQAEPPDFVTSHSARSPRRRFDVYRNNVQSSLVEVLKARYPAVQRLVGEEFFAGMARIYITEEPPRTPVMLEYGGSFAEFLARFEPVADLPYLPDVARLEWLQAIAHNAADAEPLTAEALATVPVERIGDIIFTLHPSVGLLTSPFPVFSIWRTNAHDATVVPIGREMGGEDALVVRPQFNVEVLKLPAGAVAFLDCLRQKLPLAAAVEHATSQTESFDFQRTLLGLLRSSVFSAWSL